MSRSVSASTAKNRPSPLSSKSFARYEPPTTSNARSRASTVAATPTSPKAAEHDERLDVFNKTEDEEEDVSPSITKSESLPERFDELPIELASLTDRFVESLSTKAFTEPPSIEQITQLFQDFYNKAASSISIHIAALRLKLNREGSPAQAKTPKRPLTSQKSSDSLAPPSRDGSQQMLTASEVAEKRKQRKLLDYKKLLLEEAVERRACEKIYDKIWRHKSTLDEVKDEKLRSKTAALALVGIGLKDLGIEVDEKSDKTLEDVQLLLAPARDCLMSMNDEHYPLGKLQHLTAAHKVIVDVLSSLHNSSSSADEILPTLIYTLITAPLEGINVVSNLYFIQRFRAANKVDGEAAYCMTNLEAAIGFLEDVDLTSLRADEAPEGPAKENSNKRVPSLDQTEPFPVLTPAAVPSGASTEVSKENVTGTSDLPKDKNLKAPAIKPLPFPRHQRTLSDLLKPVQSASDLVRSSARDGFDTISSTLDNSFKFLSGRLKEQSADSARPDDLTVPRTLAEARQLVSRALTPEMPDDGTAISESSSIAGDQHSESLDQATPKPAGPEDRILSLFGGRRATTSRDRSADRESIKSNSSGSKKVAFAAGESKPAPLAPAAIASPTNPLEQVKNFGSSLNPLSHLGNAFGGGFKGFGRPTPVMSPSPTSVTPPRKDGHDGVSSPKGTNPVLEPEPKLAVFMEKPDEVAAKIKSVSPPIKKFIELEDAEELKIKDVSELLADYQRLAHLLNELASGSAAPDDPLS